MSSNPLEFEIKKTIGEITKAVFSVVQEIGHQFDDGLNEACLRKELSLREITYVRVNLPFFYKGHRLDDGNFKNFIIVNDLVLLDVASSFGNENINPAKVKTLLDASGKQTAVVINFMNTNKNDMLQIFTLDD
jgi:GxxExxY protein